jgi:hypothetical protein
MLLCSDRHRQPEDTMSEEHHQATTATAEAIEASFGGRWGVWLSDTGRWWAARTSSLTSAQINVGCVPFIEADTPAELTDRIREQDRLSPGDRDTDPCSPG